MLDLDLNVVIWGGGSCLVGGGFGQRDEVHVVKQQVELAGFGVDGDLHIVDEAFELSSLKQDRLYRS